MRKEAFGAFIQGYNIFYLQHSNLQYSSNFEYTHLSLFDIVNSRNVPTYLKQVILDIPIMLNFDAFHIVEFLIFEN